MIRCVETLEWISFHNLLKQNKQSYCSSLYHKWFTFSEFIWSKDAVSTSECDGGLRTVQNCPSSVASITLVHKTAVHFHLNEFWKFTSTSPSSNGKLGVIVENCCENSLPVPEMYKICVYHSCRNESHWHLSIKIHPRPVLKIFRSYLKVFRLIWSVSSLNWYKDENFSFVTLKWWVVPMLKVETLAET